MTRNVADLASQRGHGPNVQAATGARDPGGVVYTPALQPYSEARDEAWLPPDCC